MSIILRLLILLRDTIVALGGTYDMNYSCNNPSCPDVGNSAEGFQCPLTGSPNCARSKSPEVLPGMDTPRAGSFAEVEFATAPKTAGSKLLRSLFLACLYGGLGLEIAISLMEILANQYPVAFAIGAIFLGQFLLVQKRNQRLAGPVLSDSELESRVGPMINAASRSANVKPPKTFIRRSSSPAVPFGTPQKPLLQLSQDLISNLDDQALRGIIAHELAHLANNDLSANRRRGLIRMRAIMALGILAVFTVGHGRTALFALLAIFSLPIMQLSLQLGGKKVRARELKADLAAVKAIGDPEAFIRGLRIAQQLSDELRQQLYGRPRLQWIFYPWSAKPHSHPPLEERISRLEMVSQAVPGTSTL